MMLQWMFDVHRKEAVGRAHVSATISKLKHSRNLNKSKGLFRFFFARAVSKATTKMILKAMKQYLKNVMCTW